MNISDLKSHDQVVQERKEVDAEYKALTERALATVEEILDIQPIKGADRLELATVRGWEVVVGKGEFSVGEVIVYFEIDSFLDVERPEFSFLKSRGTKRINDPENETKTLYGHALRTIKLRGQISQGLVLPLNILTKHSLYKAGTDVTDELGVLKYEPYYNPQTGQRQISTFPTKYAVKSDAERVQNLGKKFDQLKAIPGWIPTVKIDGQSVTIHKDEEGEIHISTRNFEIDATNFELKPVQWLGSNDETVNAIIPGTAVQGELFGEGIQANKLGIMGILFAPFNVFYNGTLVPRDEWEEYVGKDSLFLHMAVPTTDHEFPESIKAAVDQANDLRYPTNMSQAEGIVWHNSDPEVTKLLGRNCFKSINPLFLLKNEN